MKNLSLIATILVLGLLAACGSGDDQKNTQLESPVNPPALPTPGFASPEAITSDGSILYVSNVGKELKPSQKDGDGYILKMNINGEILSVLNKNTPLNAPKGMVVMGRRLYVTDIDRVVGFNLDNGDLDYELDMSSTGSLFLNDIAVRDSALIYVSASDVNHIFEINLPERTLRAIPTTIPLAGPNGLVYGMRGNSLFCVEMGAGESMGRILKISLTNSETRILSDFTGKMDGIAITQDSTLYFSDWATGTLNSLQLKSGTLKQIEFEKIQGPADFFYHQDNQKIFLPRMMENEIAIIPLGR